MKNLRLDNQYFDQKIDFEKLGMYNTIYQYDGQALLLAV